MPFSWKKKTRFSQLVADHLQSPKRGGSLVVETGFPTSLIDLYIRNRGRFRKSFVKKQRENDSPSPLSSLSSDSLPSSINLPSGDSDYRRNVEIVEEDVISGGTVASGGKIEGENSSKTEVERSVEIAKLNPGRFRISSVKKRRANDSSTMLSSLPSLSSSSDSLVSSDSLSLGASDHRENDEVFEEGVVFGENSSKTEVVRSVEMAKLNPVLVVVLKLLFMVVLALGTQRLKVGITVSAFLLFFLELVGKPLLGRWSLISSGVDSSNFHGTTNIKSSKQNTTVVVCSDLLEIEEQQVDSKQLDEVRNELLTEIRHKSSGKALMKSRMKKLVPKKLRRSSLASNVKISSVFNEQETVKCTDNLTLLISKQERDKIVEIEQGSSSSSSTLLILLLIVLVGLIGGRVSALVLALSWCLMLRTSQWRNVKFPIS